MATAQARQRTKPRKAGKRATRRMNKFDQSTYGGRVAARIRELRIARGWSIPEMLGHLEQEGISIPVPTLYSYERGKIDKGADLPMNLVPVFAALFGFQTAHGWLPPA